MHRRWGEKPMHELTINDSIANWEHSLPFGNLTLSIYCHHFSSQNFEVVNINWYLKEFVANCWDSSEPPLPDPPLPEGQKLLPGFGRIFQVCRVCWRCHSEGRRAECISKTNSWRECKKKNTRNSQNEGSNNTSKTAA